MAKTQKRSGGRKREKRTVQYGHVYIKASFNNTVITVTDTEGNTFAWCSSGTRGFKGAKKGTAYAAQIAAETALRAAMGSGLREVAVYTRGPGSGKEAAVRTIANLGVKIKMIKDITPVPHNGCRPRGRRRV